MATKLVKDITFFSFTAALSGVIVLWLTPALVGIRQRAEQNALMEEAARRIRETTPYDSFMSITRLTIQGSLEKPSNRQRLGLDEFEAKRLSRQLGDPSRSRGLISQIQTRGQAHEQFQVPTTVGLLKTVEMDVDPHRVRLTSAAGALTLELPALAREVLPR